jgi:hypothetical protein
MGKSHPVIKCPDCSATETEVRGGVPFRQSGMNDSALLRSHAFTTGDSILSRFAIQCRFKVDRKTGLLLLAFMMTPHGPGQSRLAPISRLSVLCVLALSIFGSAFNQHSIAGETPDPGKACVNIPSDCEPTLDVNCWGGMHPSAANVSAWDRKIQERFATTSRSKSGKSARAGAPLLTVRVAVILSGLREQLTIAISQGKWQRCTIQ